MNPQVSSKLQELIAVRTKTFTQLEYGITAMRCMASINERVLAGILDNERFSKGPGDMYFVPMTRDMVRDIKFVADELLKRMDAIAETVDMLSAEAFDAPR